MTGRRGGAGVGGADRPGRCRIELESAEFGYATGDPVEILALDEAISRLEEGQPELAAVVKLRFYAGLSVDETAKVLGMSSRSVKRDWSFARAWLYRQMDC
jgi:DNA-directed RNA polymerase specialized sigma24 family protein